MAKSVGGDLVKSKLKGKGGHSAHGGQGGQGGHSGHGGYGGQGGQGGGKPVSDKQVLSEALKFAKHKSMYCFAAITRGISALRLRHC